MAWTTPRTWATGEVVTAAMLNTHLKDNLNYLKGAAGTVSLDADIITQNTGNDKAALVDTNSYSNGTARTINMHFRARSPDSSLAQNSATIAAVVTPNVGITTPQSYLTFFTKDNTAGYGERLRIDSAGKIGIGTTSPQGRLQVNDTIGGCLFWVFNGVAGSTQTILPAGTVTDIMLASYCTKTAAGTATSGWNATAFTIAGGPIEATINGTGSSTFVLRLNVDGSVDVRRTSGSSTCKVVFWLLWL